MSVLYSMKTVTSGEIVFSPSSRKESGWHEGVPTDPGIYILHLGYKFLRSDLGYQNHYASAFLDGKSFRSTFDGTPIDRNDIKNYMVLDGI